MFNENLFYTFENYPDLRVSVSVMKFPGGEVGVNINTAHLEPWDLRATEAGSIRLEARIRSSDDIMALALAKDALDRVYMCSDIELFVPYFPYARQDRVCNPGEALSVKVMANIINSLNFNSVGVVDPHSPVTVAALDRVYTWGQCECFDALHFSWQDITIVAPDMGAAKKAEEFAKHVGAAGVIYCNKTRELSTGKITGLDVFGDTEGKRLVVLDDICDGGRTFIELYGAIQAKGRPVSVELFVTHGIFSKGIEVLSMYDRIVTTNSYDGGMKSSGNLLVVDV